jgi:hypothetical protein
VNYQKYFEIGTGSVPIILSCPHGGLLKPEFIPDRSNGIIKADTRTFIISKKIIEDLKLRSINIYYILSKIHRSKIDFNRPPRDDIAFNQSSIDAQKIHFLYHSYISKYSQDCISKYNKCLFIDFHGFTKPHTDYPDIILGHVFGQTLDIVQAQREFTNQKDNTCENYWGCTQLASELSKHYKIDDGLNLTDFNLSYSGGYITHKFYRKKKINAIQIEIAKYIRIDPELTKKFIDVFLTAILNCLKT